MLEAADSADRSVGRQEELSADVCSVEHIRELGTILSSQHTVWPVRVRSSGAYETYRCSILPRQSIVLSQIAIANPYPPRLRM